MTAANREHRSGRRYPRESPEFGRVANLSDAVFAIAMTLLVLTLDPPDVGADLLAGALIDRVPQLLAFALSFTLVASIWWAHHKFFGRLGSVEPGLIAINLVLLGLVALVPFPTSLIGDNPNGPAAVVPFIGLFVVILVVFFLMVVRTGKVEAWHRPPPAELSPWLMGSWLANIGLMTLALLVAVWVPVAGLVMAAVSGSAVGIAMRLLAPPSHRDYDL